MTKDTSMRLHRIYNVVLAVSVAVAGACLMAGCLYIYYGIGEYSREIVAQVFGYIAVPVLICLALILGGFVYELISPLKAKKQKPQKNYGHIRSYLATKKALGECDKALLSRIRRERVSRSAVLAIGAAVVTASACVFLAWALNPAHFSDSEITDSVIDAMKWLSPCLLVSGGYALFAALYRSASIKREIELLKKLPDRKDSEIGEKKEKKDKKVLFAVVKIVVILAAAAIIIYGALSGGTADVLTKAVNICTECIGLG